MNYFEGQLEYIFGDEVPEPSGAKRSENGRAFGFPLKSASITWDIGT